MKEFTITTKVNRCGNCLNLDCEDDDSESFLIYFCTELADEDSYELYEDNKHGITPSCPMYAQAVEVSE